MATPNLSPGPGSESVATPESVQGEQQARPQQQRARLLGAMVEIVASGGYARASIGELARRAGVSRGTFYELFADKEECFLNAFDEQEARLKGELLAGEQVSAKPDLESFVDALVIYAAQEPLSYEFLFHEALLAGRRASRRRDDLARWVLAQAREHEAGGANELDVPGELILGAALRLLSMYTKRDSLPAEELRGELRVLIAGYRVPRGASRWSELRPVAGLERSPADGREADAVRRSAPKGRHGLSADALRALQRERIAYGTAAAIHEKGYSEVTVSDIVAASGVSRDVFYSEFRDKHEAFNEAAKLVFEQLLARMASAYYGSTAPWPRRVWDAGNAFVGFLEAYPVLAHFLFVGTSAPHPQVDLVNEYVLAFKVFIEDGFQQGARAKEVPAIASELLVCAVLAIVTYQIRAERIRELRALLPTIVYTVIRPFLGREQAEAFIDEQVAAALAGP